LLLNFVIPLKSARVSQNWSLASQLLEQTVRSACAQTHPDFHVLIICHEKPTGVNFPQNCSVIEAPFAPPSLTVADGLNTDDALFTMRSDKGRKLLYGLELVRSNGGRYVMFLDADDLVSNRLASFVAEHQGEHGWYIDAGYKMNHGSRWFYPRRRFYEECGSSHILRSDLAPFPRNQPDYRKDLDDYYVRRYVAHAYINDKLKKLGYPLRPLPFYGGIYLVNAESFYANAFRKKDTWLRILGRWLIKGRRVLPTLQGEFGIEYPAWQKEKEFYEQQLLDHGSNSIFEGR